ncbi:MAG: uncharacterized membrane protein (UPF0127 family) [Cryomorphaceae bacterium]|jgi:uncharacterized membrane protein (UPF0127 family)
MKQVTLTTQTQRSLKLDLTETAIERVRGLFAVDMQSVDGLWIKPCNSVHTFAMKYLIDLIYLDKEQRIIKIVPGMPTWRLSMACSAHSVIELKEGLAAHYNLKVGHVLKL